MPSMHAAGRLVTTRPLRCSVAGLTGPFELLPLAAQELWAAVIEHSRSVIINRQLHANCIVNHSKGKP